MKTRPRLLGASGLASLLLAASPAAFALQEEAKPNDPTPAPAVVPAVLTTPAPASEGVPSAAVSPPVPPSASVVATAAPVDTLDYAALLPAVDPTLPDTKLDIYGFADFSLGKFFLGDGNRWNGFLNPTPSFSVGNLNVYLSGNLSNRVRSLVEVRFLYLPNGTSTTGADGTVTTTNTTVQDPVEIHRQLNWGGISVERAWVELEAHELLVIRAGQFLTPYGIWNVDHGSPAIIGVRRPFVITEALFPEHQTGLEIHGRYAPSWGTVGYHLTLSNGRGIGNEYQDLDRNKAIGGRLFATVRRFGELTVGSSFYRGRMTDFVSRWTQVAMGVTRLQTTTTSDALENAVAFDLKWALRALLVQAEFVSRRREYQDPARSTVQAAYTAYTPDHRQWGGYGLLGYRTAFFGLMPYLLIEKARFPVGATPNVMAFHAGVNVRPDPALVLKLEYFHAWFPGALAASMGRDQVTGLSAQVAWVF